MRSKNQVGSVVSLYIGSALAEEQSGVSAQMKVEPTNQSHKIVQTLNTIFDMHYEGQTIRHIGVSVGKLSIDFGSQLDLFTPFEEDIKAQQIDTAIDRIRKKFGVTSIVKSSSKIDGGTMIDRAGLVGGHNGGNAYG